jgi:cysteine desulfurase/selenocysteine lyase
MDTPESVAPPEAGRFFTPDPQVIERLANAFFKGIGGGAPTAPPATPTSAPAPWTPSAPATTTLAQAVPVQPPFGAPDPLATSLPASAPFRSFGGASAGSATPHAPFVSRAVAPAAAQMLLSPPRPDPPALASPENLSPFATEIDLRAALSGLLAGFRAPQAPALPSPPSASRDSAETPYDLDRQSPPGPLTPSLSDSTSGVRLYEAAAIREDFPILREKIHGRRLIWLDNGATTQKPQAVIDRLAYFYAHENSNVHRGAHTLAARATDAYEAAREKTRRFLNAASTKEIVFVRGATEGVNLVAQSWGRRNLRAGDEIVVTHLEHHANIVPWQQICAETGAKLRVAPVDDRGDVRLDEYEKLFHPRTRLAAFTSVSNALGTVTPAQEMIAIAHRHGALALVDGAQSVPHARTDVAALNADFFVLSGHKMYAPTGIGVVYGKQAVLESMPPWQGGGNMIADVTFERTIYQQAPERFEAGTGNIADAVGLGAAIDYLDRIGMEAIARHEHELIEATVAGLGDIPGLRLIGSPRERAGVVSFVLDGCRAEDVGKALDREGIAVRAGHHCAQPILRRFGLEATVRPSFGLYNTHEDVEALVAAVRRIAAQAQGGSRGR